MQNRICEKCGTRFTFRTFGDGLPIQIFALIVWCGVLGIIDTVGNELGHERWGFWIGFCLGVFAFQKIVESREKAFRKCPSCGNSGIAIDSPLGMELKERAKELFPEQTKKATERLLLGAERSNVREIKPLLDAGADVNAMDPSGLTVMMLASEGNPNPEVIEVLGKAGADVDAVTGGTDRFYAGRTPLMLAAWRNRNFESIRRVLERRPSINSQDCRGMTALMWCTGRRRRFTLDDLSLLIRRSTPRIALAWSILCESRSPTILRLMIDYGADVNVQDNEGKTALDHAQEMNDVGAINVLLRAGAKNGAVAVNHLVTSASNSH